MSYKPNHIGERRTMNCGIEAEIIEYNNSHDITVRFDDNTISAHKRYDAFKLGSIGCPRTPRIGERNRMNCGIDAEIIKYNNNRDITVRFDDGVVCEHKQYVQFKSGTIGHDGHHKPHSWHIGERRIMHCGREAEIIDYKNRKDITVRFDNGAISEHKNYRSFMLGHISDRVRTSRIGERKMMNCGLSAEIVDYINSKDITVRFDNGTVVPHARYSSFSKGAIVDSRFSARVGSRKISRLGECRMMNCGMKAKIIGYNNTRDITVEFEDGSVAEHKQYGQFQDGGVGYPNARKSYSRKPILYASTAAQAKERIGNTRLMNCGLQAKIVEYVNSQNITVQFDDGSTVKGKTHREFLRGSIHPPISHRVGEKRIMNNGLTAEIVQYRLAHDIDVRFEDGTIVSNKSYGSFLKGQIRNPNYKREHI